MKICKIIGFVFLSIVLGKIIDYCDSKEWSVWSNIAGILLGMSLPSVWHSIQDL